MAEKVARPGSTLKVDPDKRLSRGRPKKTRGISPASKEQREKIRFFAADCLVCGRDEHDGVKVDPAHLISRALGGCDSEWCVVPLCREHHRAFDDGKLDLLPMLEPRWRREVAHAVEHVGVLAALHRLTGQRYRPENEEET